MELTRDLPRRFLENRVAPWLRDRENLLFALFIAVQLIPIWAFRYFPSQDGPAHLNNANVLREYARPDRSVFREYYTLHWDPDPNWIGHLLLAGLMTLFPMLIAEKLLLTGYVVLLALSFRYALNALRPGAGKLVFLIFPFTFNYLLHMGFYNFSYSLIFFFFLVGYWIAHQERVGLRETVVFTLLSLGLYFSHIVSLVIAWVAIGILAVWLLVLDAAGRRVSLGEFWNRVKMRGLLPLYASLPAIALVIAFLRKMGTGRSSRLAADLQWRRLRKIESLVSYNAAGEGRVASTLFVVFVVGIVLFLFVKLVRRRWNRWDGLLLVVGAFVWVFFAAPDAMSGGGFISHRLILYPYLGLLLWFGAQELHRSVRWGMSAVAVGFALWLMVVQWPRYAGLNDLTREYLSGMDRIAPNSTLLPLTFSRHGYDENGRVLAERVGPFLHAAGYIGAARKVVELDNYEATTAYFPVRFRPELNPFAFLARDGRMEVEPPRVDIPSYAQRTKGRVDYVLIWQLRSGQRDNPDTQSILRQLAEGYDLIFTSPQHGFMKLYRRKGFRPSTAETTR